MVIDWTLDAQDLVDSAGLRAAGRWAKSLPSRTVNHATQSGLTNRRMRCLALDHRSNLLRSLNANVREPVVPRHELGGLPHPMLRTIPFRGKQLVRSSPCASLHHCSRHRPATDFGSAQALTLLCRPRRRRGGSPCSAERGLAMPIRRIATGSRHPRPLALSLDRNRK